MKPTLPPIPVKPVASKDKKSAGTDRRSFVAACLSPMAIGFGSMAATSLIWLLDLARFMFPNVLVEPPTKFKIGPPSDYPLGGVSTKWLAARGVWIVHTDQYKGRNLIYALASVCTHLGCTPNWLEGEQKYKCPCHGSGFYINGVNFEGPAPHRSNESASSWRRTGSWKSTRASSFRKRWDSGRIQTPLSKEPWPRRLNSRKV